MLIIEHRINWVDSLIAVPSSHGVEIDLRSDNDEIILEHDPFKKGELFLDWLKHWNGQFLVLNVKEEGLEERIVEILLSHKISDYFFLDQSFPFMQKLIRSGNKRTASRASDLESVETALLAGAEWCWLDSFSGRWDYLVDAVPLLNGSRIRTCLVSPELQRQNGQMVELKGLHETIENGHLSIDAVCTKDPNLWKNL